MLVERREDDGVDEPLARGLDRRIEGAQCGPATRFGRFARPQFIGGEVGTLTLDQFSDMNKREFESYGKLIKAAGIKVE